MPGVAHLGDEAEHVFLAAEIGVQGAGFAEELFESGESLGQQGAFGAEVVSHQPGQLDRTTRAGSKAYLTLGAVLHVDLAEGRLEARRQSRLAAALPFQVSERELEMLAGAQGIG